MHIDVTVTITHDGPQELKIELHQYLEARDKECRYFVSLPVTTIDKLDRTYKRTAYLHSDGSIQMAATPNGWFTTIAQVKEAIQKYIKNKEHKPTTYEPIDDHSFSHYGTNLPQSLSEVKDAVKAVPNSYIGADHDNHQD